MAKLMQVYGISINEALRLSEAHVSVMLEHLDAAATELLQNDTEFQKSLGERLAPIRRVVRAELGGGWEFEPSPEFNEDDAPDQSGYAADSEESAPDQSDAPPAKPSRPKPTGKPLGKPPRT